MLPTLRPGQIVIVGAGHYRRHPPQRGDIATVRDEARGWLMIKRVVGLPGETLEIREGVVHVDGKALKETYVAAGNARSEYSTRMRPTTLPAGHYFLLGDNRDSSEDSRIWGAVPREDLESKLSARL